MIREFDRKNDLTLTRQQMRDFDAWAINQAHVPGVVLMENAGRGCAEIVMDELKKSDGRKVCIFCGTGNNGGDGFVIARHLKNAGFEAKIVLCGPNSKIKGDALINYNIACKSEISTYLLDPDCEDIESNIKNSAGNSDLIVDAIFGTGFSGRLRGGFKNIVNTINSLGKPIIAVDIPSGLDCDAGLAEGTAIKAAITVTFAAAKKGFANESSSEYTGKVYIASIGIEPAEKKTLS
ncbi:MAG: NAD(P)H-hydrate epimerase [Sedimentisphaerales bacterium]|nr:NAD(P)H-hydrate epimerase [Sedimentisphaerales bacterium]